MSQTEPALLALQGHLMYADPSLTAVSTIGIDGSVVDRFRLVYWLLLHHVATYNITGLLAAPKA